MLPLPLIPVPRIVVTAPQREERDYRESRRWDVDGDGLPTVATPCTTRAGTATATASPTATTRAPTTRVALAVIYTTPTGATATGEVTTGMVTSAVIGAMTAAAADQPSPPDLKTGGEPEVALPEATAARLRRRAAPQACTGVRIR